MQLCSIASGSSGNCIYMGTDNTHLLVDAGISGKKIEHGLQEIGIKADEIQGLLVTHEHVDHIAGLGVMARRYGYPIYATQGTIDAIMAGGKVGKVDMQLFRVIRPDEDFVIGDLKVQPYHISHDAADPVCYVFRQGAKSGAVVTDLGVYDSYLISKLQKMDLLFVEANHDIRMLQVGRYPYYLKQRILGERGHLSNEMTGQLLSELLHDDTKAVMLGHLSHENNYPELAFETVRLEIAAGDNKYKADDFPIHVAPRSQLSTQLFV
ncbi:MBL fold metallo-hydrolase [Eubacterium oxidoreducens]|uniref:Phosphoribosyl 1,2-cyclic phosphodiesterase n=1 Tax=Eubacterium oxidoreducens TaxID=1732 RepID=A0A1G6BHX1_EUBOX|nr:MBL fold metallo-hydrolase [Eubacterium oxidoreducens]SDB20197.1 Phosphoribosyl 1,2-cyclic phosphodiesterase [Eubacterium oxidoreducens]